MNEKKILEAAIAKWGVEEQLIMLSEECSELSQAALKYRKSLKYNLCAEKVTKSFDNLTEEIADVEIMIEQMRLAFRIDNIEELVPKFRSQKLERLAKILKVKQ